MLLAPQCLIGDIEPMTQERIKCPFCSELILRDAIKCRFCGEWFVKEEERVRPDSPHEDLRSAWRDQEEERIV